MEKGLICEPPRRDIPGDEPVDGLEDELGEEPVDEPLPLAVGAGLALAVPAETPVPVPRLEPLALPRPAPLAPVEPPVMLAIESAAEGAPACGEPEAAWV
jgi:hypothetical protein